MENSGTAKSGLARFLVNECEADLTAAKPGPENGVDAWRSDADVSDCCSANSGFAGNKLRLEGDEFR
jgi:hypothetical protein